jgi:hypothetical protein
VVAVVGRVLVLVVLVALAGPARAPARTVAIGIGEPNAGMFTNPWWQRLGIPEARYLTAWDTLQHRRQIAELDAWMAAARAERVRVTLSFKHSRRARRDGHEFPTKAPVPCSLPRLPPPLCRGSRLRRLERAEPSRVAEPQHPGRVADMFDVAARNCAGYLLVGAGVLDMTGMTA